MEGDRLKDTDLTPFIFKVDLNERSSTKRVIDYTKFAETFSTIT